MAILSRVPKSCDLPEAVPKKGMTVPKEGTKTFEVTVTQGTVKPKGGVEQPFERTFTVQAKTPQQAAKSIRDAGIKADRVDVREKEAVPTKAAVAPPSEPPVALPTKAKEPWQMTNAEFSAPFAPQPTYEWYKAFGWPEGYTYNHNPEYRHLTGHHGIVKSAVDKGLPVPAVVLADYPDLQGKKAGFMSRPTPEFKRAFLAGVRRGANKRKARKPVSTGIREVR